MMKRIITITALIFAWISSMAQGSIKVNVMSMNIKAGEYALYRTDGYAELINARHPDFVCLQEVDYRTLRCGLQDFLGKLAEQTGMFPYFCQSISYQGGGFGVAILSRYPFFKAAKIVSKIEGAREARATGWVYVQLPDGNIIRVASTHLALESSQITIRNIADINANILKDTSVPTLLIGDFNATPDSDAIKYCKIKWQEIGAGAGFTIPSDNPNRQLDYIMGYPKKWTALRYEILRHPELSDHCFVSAEVSYEE